MKRLLSIEETTAQTGISRAALYKKLKSGELTALKVGARTLIRSEDLETFLEGLPKYTAA